MNIFIDSGTFSALKEDTPNLKPILGIGPFYPDSPPAGPTASLNHWAKASDFVGIKSNRFIVILTNVTVHYCLTPLSMRDDVHVEPVDAVQPSIHRYVSRRRHGRLHYGG